MKYWNKARVVRVRARRKRAEDRAAEREIARRRRENEHQRSYTPGDKKKNARIMLDALALPLRRKMVARLVGEGTMPLSRLIEPFRFTLPTAQFHLRILERANVVKTYKTGRHRFVAFNPKAFSELASFLTVSPEHLT